MIQNKERFDQLVTEALNQDFSGWDFSHLAERITYEDLPWDYAEHVRQHIKDVDSMIDMGTGGGEFLSSLVPLPSKTVATEGWAVNVPVAKKRLEPLGIEVYHVDDKHALPFDPSTFDLIINRHDAFEASDLYRVLKPNGFFITQQVGGKNSIRFNELLDAPPHVYHDFSLDGAVKELEDAGFDILLAEEYFPDERYLDIGAVVCQLSVIEWQIPDFSVERYYDKLGMLHNMIEADDYLSIPAHRFFIKAQKK